MSTSSHTPTHQCVFLEGHPACASYQPGHNVHHIQGRLAVENQDRWVPVALSAPRGNTVEATLPHGQKQTWWCHDAARLERFHALLRHGAGASFDPGTALATVEHEPGVLTTLYPEVVAAP